jgi:anti-sigma factor RsiW
MVGGAQIELCMLEEHHLEAYATGLLDPPTREAIEAYLLHHPEARRRVEAYRQAKAESWQRRRRWDGAAPRTERCG